MLSFLNLEKTRITNLTNKIYFSFSSLEEFYKTTHNIQNGDLITFWNLKNVYRFKAA